MKRMANCALVTGVCATQWLIDSNARADEPSAPSQSTDGGRDAGQTADAADEEANEVVVTGTRTAEDPSRSAVRVDVITRKTAEERGATNVAEALASELTTDVSASGYGSLGGPAGAKIAGLDGERVLVLIDGERLGGNVGGVLDLAELSLAGVDRIEIVEGPVSALYGTSGLGGVINVITGPPEQEGPSGRARVEGRYRWGGLAQGALAYREGIAWFALDASILHQDGIERDDYYP
jgi:outer membrane receptor for ferrienterochelin and colicins